MTQAVSDKCVGTLSAKWRDSLSDKSLDNTNWAIRLRLGRQQIRLQVMAVAPADGRQSGLDDGLVPQPSPEYECKPLKYMLTTVKLKITEAMPMRLSTATFVGPQPRVARACRYAA